MTTSKPTNPAREEVRPVVPKLIELLDQVAAEAAPDTPWATDSKRLADALRADPNNFTRIQQALVEVPGPSLPTGPATDPLGPLAPGTPGGPVMPVIP